VRSRSTLPRRSVAQETPGRKSHKLTHHVTDAAPPDSLAHCAAPLAGEARSDRRRGAAGDKPVGGATGASNREFAKDCAPGNIRYAAHDFDGAIALYRKAVELA